MEHDSKYSLGYTHGVEQARPIVDLGHRVTRVEDSLKVGKWVLGITALMMAISMLGKTSIINKIFRRKEDKKDWRKDEHKEKRDWKQVLHEGRQNNVTKTEAIVVRRHAREFNVSRYR